MNTSLKFTCIKISGKLVWSIGIRIAPKKPNAIPTPTNSQTTYLTVRDVALREIKARWDANINNVGILTLVLQPNLPEFVSQAITASAKSAMRLYGREFLPDATVFAGGKSDWYTQAYCAYTYPLDWQSDCLKGTFGGPGSGSGWPVEYPLVDASGATYGPINKDILNKDSNMYLASPAYIYLSSFENKSDISASVKSTPAHELFHTLQQFQFGGGATTSESAKNLSTKVICNSLCTNLLSQNPSLWVEGSAYYFGYASAEMINPKILDNNGLPLSPSWIKEQRYPIEDVIQWNVNDMRKSPEKGNYVYFVGALMTELLVADFGLTKVFEFTKNSSKGLTDPNFTFVEDFKRTFGTDWSSWYPIANTYIENTLSGKPTYARDLGIYAQ